MIIRTRDNMKLINIRMFSIREERLILRRFILEGTYGSQLFFLKNTIEICSYEDEDEALKKLDEIEDFFRKNPNGIYKI
ncbi:hypothetical protein ACH36K_09320 [Clostridium sp. MB05]|jgi:hypothetical protein|uniref:hypothetical protein n=1 Tax=Clostridium sp. MB05 TaxID=3376682 RepID=UPI0039820224